MDAESFLKLLVTKAREAIEEGDEDMLDNFSIFTMIADEHLDEDVKARIGLRTGPRMH